MQANAEKQKYLNWYFEKKIREMFYKGIPQDEQEVYDKKISYAEAVIVLQHTMDRLRDIPLDFSF
ncbi:hypothetical protein [Solibaculum mannosilyticum]|uniref:Uncharacterized protein n=1 Tax=Solibaculum mannosilyticum TaxID=2780922 RepID=A0A7I8D467_9FIRM|nr:hypothetical protein [Solibaculum mannosilyticum]BCI60825.1 hypothetical protein C12CBH8_14640 [Solibaculum mannosilyticum]